MKRRGATITDVAAHAKVSRATAARVLGNYGYASEKVRDAVLASARQLGYEPSRIAKTMRNGKSQLLGFVCADISDGLFSEALGGICSVADDEGYQVVVFNSADRLIDEREGVRALLSHGVDGLIVSPVILSQSDHLFAAARNVPLVCLDRGLDGLSAAVSDNREAARRAVESLIRQGHRDIALFLSMQAEEPIGVELVHGVVVVHGPERPATLRALGYLDAMAEVGGPVDADRLVLSEHRKASPEETRRWLVNHPEVTAVVAADSYQAPIVFRALRDAALSVPGDLSLVCFSDAEWTELVSPRLETVTLDGFEMGAKAASALLRHISDGGDPVLEVVASVTRAGESITAPRSTQHACGPSRGSENG